LFDALKKGIKGEKSHTILRGAELDVFLTRHPDHFPFHAHTAGNSFGRSRVPNFNCQPNDLSLNCSAAGDCLELHTFCNPALAYPPNLAACLTTDDMFYARTERKEINVRLSNNNLKPASQGDVDIGIKTGRML
jgi:hypothetical protein